MTTGLRTEGLTVRFGEVVALDSVDIDVQPGELVGLIGPNGAGKTTFIDALTGFARCTGEAFVDDVPVHGIPAYKLSRASLGRTWQSAELFDELTVRENLEVSAASRGLISQLRELLLPTHTASSDVGRTLELLGLDEVADRLPSELTQGQRKLVDVGRALAAGRRFLCLDEPAAGLNTDESAQLGVFLRRVVDSGVGILLVDHDMGLVLSVCDRIFVLALGKIVAHGTPEEIRSSRVVIDAYLGGDDEVQEHERATSSTDKGDVR